MPELQELTAPPARPSFRDDVFELAEARERQIARRWRGLAVAATAAAAAAVSTAGVLAFGSAGEVSAARTFDETRSCPVVVQGGIPVAMLSAHSTVSERNNGQMFTLIGMTALIDHNGHGLGAITGAVHGYGFPDEMCTKTKQIPLTRGGLPLYAVFRPGDRGLGSFDNGAACWVAPRISVRVHAVIDSSDRPTSGTLVLRSGKKLRPIAYVDWQPKRVAVYFGDDCHY